MSDFQTFDPAHNQALKVYSHASDNEIESALSQLHLGFKKSQMHMALVERKQWLPSVAKALRSQKIELARQICLETGKPVKSALAEVEKSATAFDYYFEKFDSFFIEEKVQTSTHSYRVWPEPMGPLFAIMPWNFPVWQLMRVLPPALAIGNPILLKHSDQVAGSAELIEQIVQSGVGPQMFGNLRLDHDQAARVIADPRIRAVTLTGSSRAGREVASLAGRSLKKVVLELGGSDPYLVLRDADIEMAAQLCAQSRMINNGQSCIAAKRFIVHEEVLKPFTDFFIQELEKINIGDPLLNETDVGPLADLRFKKGLTQQTQRLSKQGARLLFKQDLHLPAELQKGAYFAPQVWQVRGDEEVVNNEEFFGPVALVMSFQSEEEALRLANRSVYGLGGAVFTGDRRRAEVLARGLDCGFVAFNDYVRSDPHVPFGGSKDSGFGRELGVEGLREFINLKTTSELLVR